MSTSQPTTPIQSTQPAPQAVDPAEPLASEPEPTTPPPIQPQRNGILAALQWLCRPLRRLFRRRHGRTSHQQEEASSGTSEERPFVCPSEPPQQVFSREQNESMPALLSTPASQVDTPEASTAEGLSSTTASAEFSLPSTSRPLQTELLHALTPLLAPAARLLAKDRPIDTPHLTQLLVAAGLDEYPEALAELQRWSRLLAGCRRDPDNLHDATMEALLARGVPEAVALMAIKTACQTVKLPQETEVGPDQAPQASVARLDFNALPPGEPATAEFQVKGGPGRILLENHLVQVTPDTFGPGPTLVRVRVSPLEGGMVWTPLRLVTRVGELSIPLLATWETAESELVTTAPSSASTTSEGTDQLDDQDEPQSAPREAGGDEPFVVVAPEGGGDFTSLEEALTQAPPAATIRLAPGVHRLRGPLKIDRAVRLEGQIDPQNPERVRVEGQGHKYLVLFKSDTLVQVAHIHFVHQGDAPCNVVCVRQEGIQSEVHFENCAFEGGKCDSQGNLGSGLRLRGCTQGEVRDCLALNNEGHGFRIEGKAQLTLVKNTAKSNGGSGILLSDRTSGELLENLCQENHMGIRVQRHSRPTLTRNRCLWNRKAGICCTAQTQPVLKHNHCEHNGSSGIDIYHRARVKAVGNCCAKNKGAGIVCWDDTTGELVDNTCTNNTCAGIHITDRAYLTVRRNSCSHNGTVGLAFVKASGGLAENNRCEANEQAGIGLSIRAAQRVKLKGNIGDICNVNANPTLGLSNSSPGRLTP